MARSDHRTGDLFDNGPDAIIGRLLKERGMTAALEAAQQYRSELLEQAREDCRRAAMARDTRMATANDYYRAQKRRGGMITPDPLGPAAGSIFKTKDWEPVFVVPGQQRTVTSERPSNHARELKVWKLK